jgi:hypothetical protein
VGDAETDIGLGLEDGDPRGEQSVEKQVGGDVGSTKGSFSIVLSPTSPIDALVVRNWRRWG